MDSLIRFRTEARRRMVPPKIELTHGIGGGISRVAIAIAFSLTLVSCAAIWNSASTDDNPIKVGQPEIYENADLQSRLDQLQDQLSTLSALDQASLISAIPNVQSVVSRQAGFSVQVTGPGTPTVPASSTPIAPTAATLPGVSLASRGVLDQQLQLSSQIIGYQLLLSGSEFARYTSNGTVKDRIVIGFPVTINAGTGHQGQAAEVRVTYFPPNAGQFQEPRQFVFPNDPDRRNTRDVCASDLFSPGDPNAEVACLEQERSPTIVNILPSETSYNAVGYSSSSSTFGLGAVIGKVTAGASGGGGRQTQYLVAEQDTVATEEAGPTVCPVGALRSNDGVQCVANSRGVAFKWQFRPVLGERAVRGGERRLYVQLAIPYSRRPYANYGGIVEITTDWVPFDSSRGLVSGPPMEKHTVVRAVFGQPFTGPIVSKVAIQDLGGGSLLVTVTGSYLIGATVRIGTTTLDSSSAGFAGSYDSLQFSTTAQALAQSGAVITSSNGVDTPLTANSLCKAADSLGECFRSPEDSADSQFRITQIWIDPISATNSLVTIHLKTPLAFQRYIYHRYFSLGGDVVGTSEQRKPTAAQRCLDDTSLMQVNELPIVVEAGGKTYGFSDLPLQYIDHDSTADTGKSARQPRNCHLCHLCPLSSDKHHSTDDSESSTGPVISFIASNDSLNTSPRLKVQRIFGDPESDSSSISFLPPNAVSVTPLANYIRQSSPDAAAAPPSLMINAGLTIAGAHRTPITVNGQLAVEHRAPTNQSEVKVAAPGSTSAGVAAPSAAPMSGNAPAATALASTAVRTSVARGWANSIFADGTPAAPPSKHKPTTKLQATPCTQATQTCHYALTGALLDQVCLEPHDSSPNQDPCPTQNGKLTLYAPEPAQHSIRELSAKAGSKQVSLQFALRSGGSNEAPTRDADEAPAGGDRKASYDDGNKGVPTAYSVAEILTLPLSAASSAPSSDSTATVSNMTEAIPNFTLTRAVSTVRSVAAGIAYITVGIQNLKDPSVTLTVLHADIVTATDGSNNTLSIQPGQQVTVTQSTSVTFKLRSADPTLVNVTAEGKNGTLSTGKVQFSKPFVITDAATDWQAEKTSS